MVSQCVGHATGEISIYAHIVVKELKMPKKHPLEYYDQVNVRLNGRSLQAWRVGAYIFILKFKHGYRVCRSNKNSIVKCSFASLDHAIEFSEWLIEKYGQYFSIWDDYPDVDVTSLAKWSVDDGLILHEMLKELNEIPRIDNLKQVNDIYYKVKEYAEEAWTGGFRSYM